VRVCECVCVHMYECSLVCADEYACTAAMCANGLPVDTKVSGNYFYRPTQPAALMI